MKGGRIFGHGADLAGGTFLFAGGGFHLVRGKVGAGNLGPVRVQLDAVGGSLVHVGSGEKVISKGNRNAFFVKRRLDASPVHRCVRGLVHTGYRLGDGVDQVAVTILRVGVNVYAVSVAGLKLRQIDKTFVLLVPFAVADTTGSQGHLGIAFRRVCVKNTDVVVLGVCYVRKGEVAAFKVKYQVGHHIGKLRSAGLTGIAAGRKAASRQAYHKQQA